METLLDKAVRTGNQFEMIYLDARDQITKRIVSIYEVKRNSIKAYCFKRRGIRTFNYEGILAIYCLPHSDLGG